MAQCDAPVTATPEPLVAELTLPAERPLDELVIDDAVDELELLAVVEEALPGIVAALTAPNSATPAKPATATAAVSRLSSRRAASRAWTRELSMRERLRSDAESDLGAT